MREFLAGFVTAVVVLSIIGWFESRRLERLIREEGEAMVAKFRRDLAWAL